MIDHVVLEVRDHALSKEFYVAALEPLGLELMRDFDGMSGFGRDGKPWFWVRQGEPAAGVHVGFTAPDQATVEAFHAAALGAGGQDNGAPGERPHYHAGYYGAFVLDPDGNNIEAVFRGTSAGAGEN
jgi:catechol 2,3-dioxygenase-like lactoylglutathione lyase family enzyme